MKPKASSQCLRSRDKKKKSAVEVLDVAGDELYRSVRSIIAGSRAKIYVAANAAMVEAYWNVGREIVEKQGGKAKAKYGDGLIRSLATRLTAEFGDGFAESNLRYMRLVYLAFPICHTLCDKLSWSHYRTLIKCVPRGVWRGQRLITGGRRPKRAHFIKCVLVDVGKGWFQGLEHSLLNVC